MIIYSKQELYKKYIQQEAENAFKGEFISEGSYKNILTAHPCTLYTPNNFIRIALATLTLVAVIFSTILLGIIFQFSLSAGVLIFLAIACYVVLELLVSGKRYYNAGVDNMLMVTTIFFFSAAFAVKDYPGQDIVVSLVTVITCLAIGTRFVSSLLFVVAYFAFLVFAFFLFTKMGNIAKATAPFFMMIISAVIYWVMNNLSNKRTLLFFQDAFKEVKMFTLFTFYAAGNYYVVKELSNDMFHLGLGLHDSIALGWLFWLLTFTIPTAYIFYGIRKKDLMFLRIGFVLVAVAVFTFRYYYSVLPAETAMLVAGAFLIGVSYALIKYLKIARHGFAFKKTEKPPGESAIHDLILTEVTSKQITIEDGVEFGGGKFGGGGGGGTF